MPRRGNISVQIPLKIKKRIHVYCIRKNMTLGSFASQAMLHFMTDGIKEDMAKLKAQEDSLEIEQLKKETEEIQALIDDVKKVGRKISKYAGRGLFDEGE